MKVLSSANSIKSLSGLKLILIRPKTMMNIKAKILPSSQKAKRRKYQTVFMSLKKFHKRNKINKINSKFQTLTVLMFI